MSKPRVLVVDDGEDYAAVVRDRMPEFELVSGDFGDRVPDGPAALAYLAKRGAAVDVVLLDMHFDAPAERLLPLGEGVGLRRTRRYQGVAILREIRRRHPAMPVVLLTSVEDLAPVDLADEWRGQSLVYFLDEQDTDALRIRINAALREASADLEEDDILWGANPSMRRIRRRLAVLARGTLPIILEGETGTGKSFLAEKYVHARSGRGGPFVTVDLATVPVDLIPAHLFGAVRGAYTGAVADVKGVFEIADKGTLFIDEIQNVPLEIQKQLLLVLQEGRVRPLGSRREAKVDVKVIAASNRPLAEAVAEGRFRPDLYMRLSPSTRVTVPPLRERPDDLEFLARRLAQRTAREPFVAATLAELAEAEGGDAAPSIELTIGRARVEHPDTVWSLAMPGAAWRLMKTHDWPGNLRELAMVVHNAVTFTLVAAADAARSGSPMRSRRLQIDPGLIGELLAGIPAAKSDDAGAVAVCVKPAKSLSQVAADVERQYFRELYRRTGGDFEAMAEHLLGDRVRARAVRLRFNQLGLKVREIRRGDA